MFAARLVMAGVDPRTVQELGGWRTLGMVQRYAHLAPERLAAAVERIVAPPSDAPADTRMGESAAMRLRQNFGDAAAHAPEPRAGVS